MVKRRPTASGFDLLVFMYGVVVEGAVVAAFVRESWNVVAAVIPTVGV